MRRGTINAAAQSRRKPPAESGQEVAGDSGVGAAGWRERRASAWFTRKT
jgi:hypothetical protein